LLPIIIKIIKWLNSFSRTYYIHFESELLYYFCCQSIFFRQLYNTMNIKLFFTVGLWIASLGISAQSNVNKSYHRMEGTIGNDIEVTANFIRLFDRVEGNYQYKFVEQNGRMFFGKVLELEGTLLKNDSLYLKEYGAGSYAFKGIWKDGTYTGQWIVPGGDGKKLPVSLKEYYPKGSMAFDVFYLNSKEKLKKDVVNSPTAELEMTFVYPKANYIQPDIVDSVKRIVIKGFFGGDFLQASPVAMMKDFEKEYFFNYKDANLEIYDETKGASFDWSSVNSMSIVYNASYLLCVEYQKYAFTGGAHGMTNVSYDIIDLTNGKGLSYSDIFVDNADSALTALLTKKMLEKYKTKSESDLKDIGFFVDSITPNQNVYVTGNGVGFKYASYELAPYSYGLPEVFLSFDEIKPLIRKGTPVYRLSRQNQE